MKLNRSIQLQTIRKKLKLRHQSLKTAQDFDLRCLIVLGEAPKGIEVRPNTLWSTSSQRQPNAQSTVNVSKQPRQVNNASQQCEKRNQTMLIVVTKRQNQQACLASLGETTEQLSWPIYKQSSETTVRNKLWTRTRMNSNDGYGMGINAHSWADWMSWNYTPNRTKSKRTNRWNPKWNN